MKSLQFTSTPLSKRKPVKYGNDKGNLYINEHVHISGKYDNTNKNFNNFVTIIKDNKSKEDDELFKNKPYTKKQITSILYLLQLKREKIINVYQETYSNTNNEKYNATGLGDFIRGSYFIMQYCTENNLSCNITLLNHPISQFLEYYTNCNAICFPNINKFECLNYKPTILNNNIITSVHDFAINNDFTYYLQKQQSYNNHKFVYVISYPNIFIESCHKEYMQTILKPSNQLLLLIENELTNLCLIKHEYTVLHVRYGDNELLKDINATINENTTNIEANKNIDILTTTKLKILKHELDNLDPDSDTKYLLISDNIHLKTNILKHYSFIKTTLHDICHTGEGIKMEYNKLQNVLLEFYLISFANQVNAYSVYEHGSGFSKWCAETYSIPYICKLLK